MAFKKLSARHWIIVAAAVTSAFSAAIVGIGIWTIWSTARSLTLPVKITEEMTKVQELDEKLIAEVRASLDKKISATAAEFGFRNPFSAPAPPPPALPPSSE